MKINAFIDQLQQMQAEHGDIEIAVLLGITLYDFGLQKQQLGDNDIDVTHISIVYDDEEVIEY